jgi:hypothetical protein
VTATVKKKVLVVANVTATSDELRQALVQRAQQAPVAFTLLVPATRAGGELAAAQRKLATAVQRLRQAGLEVEGTVGDSDPLVAVAEAWDPRRYDEIIVSTLPMRISKWLHAGLPERIFRLTGAPVTHVVSEPPKPPRATAPRRPHHHDKAALGPLSVLAWGKPHDPVP